MKKFTLLAIFGIITVSSAFSQDFREHFWGDSMTKVKASEGNQGWEGVETEEDFLSVLTYESNIGGLEAVIAFYFVEDKLFAGRYIFIEDHNNENEYLTDFDCIDKNLQEKYGSKKVEREWTVDTWKDSRDYWGLALKQRELSISTEWEVSDGTNVTEIYHDLYGADSDIVHRITYNSVELEAHFDDLRKKENVF